MNKKLFGCTWKKQNMFCNKPANGRHVTTYVQEWYPSYSEQMRWYPSPCISLMSWYISSGNKSMANVWSQSWCCRLYHLIIWEPLTFSDTGKCFLTTDSLRPLAGWGNTMLYHEVPYRGKVNMLLIFNKGKNLMEFRSAINKQTESRKLL